MPLLKGQAWHLLGDLDAVLSLVPVCRIDKEAPVQYVPTLYHWTPAGPGARISNQLNSDEEVEALRVGVIPSWASCMVDTRVQLRI
jgi:hypothetical protein